jgi:hypothetical protein
MGAHENPFATRFIEPGALDYAFFGNGGLDQLCENFYGACHGRAAIVGPHGSGKSTLLHSLVPYLGRVVLYRDLADHAAKGVQDEPRISADNTKSIRWFRLSSQARDTRQVLDDRQCWDSKTVLVIDGFEQIPLWMRFCIQWQVQLRSSGLLVTAHAKPIGLPVLWRTDVTQQSAEYVVRTLLAGRQVDADRLLASPEWGMIRRKWDNNLREALFELYDLIEDKRFS